MGLIDKLFKKKNEKGSFYDSDDTEYYEKRKNLLEEINNFYNSNEEEKLREDIRLRYSDIINNNHNVIKELYFNNWNILDFLDEKNKEYVIRNFSEQALDINKDFGFYSMNYVNVRDEAVKFFPKSLLNDKDFIIEYISLYPNILEVLPDNLKNDIDFISTLCLRDVDIISYVDDDVLNNPNFILSIIDKRLNNYLNEDMFLIPYKLDFIFEDFLEKDKNFCLEIINRGLIEYYPDMGEAIKIDRVIMSEVLDKLNDFEKSRFLDLKGINSFELSDIIEEFDIYNERKLNKVLDLEIS